MQRTFVKGNRLERINTGNSTDVNVVSHIASINEYVQENSDSLDYSHLDEMLSDFSKSIRVQRKANELIEDGWVEVISTPRASSKTKPVSNVTQSND